MTDQLNGQVLIVGAGPTGLTAALELRRFGVPVTIVDEMEAASTTSRAVGIQARTLEEMQLRGLSEEFVRLGHRATGVSLYGGGKQVGRLNFTGIESSFNYLLFLSQSETERILREALAKLGTTVERGRKMIAFAQSPAGVTATLRSRDGSLEEVHAAYLISAEGAHSTVRSTLNLQFKGNTLEANYALGDLNADGQLPDSDIHIFSSEHGFMGLFPMGGPHFRFIASHPASEPSTSAPPTLAELQSIYDERSPIPARFRDLSWSSWFRINSRMVDTLRAGRIFLAGDAAHIHSPAGGQGMNTGIQDMMNLGWKLALVLDGRAPESLLDTYEHDRLPVMRAILTGTKALTEIIGSESPVVRNMFNHIAPLIAGTEFAQQKGASRISQIALNYRESSLSGDHAASGSLRAGDRVPDIRVGVIDPDSAMQERGLMELLDPNRFTLLLANHVEDSVRSEALAAVEPYHDLIRAMHIGAGEPAGGGAFNKHFGPNFSLALVRPDAYIGFRGGHHAAGRLAEYCKRWLTPMADRKPA